jgi:hypothetical protein
MDKQRRKVISSFTIESIPLIVLFIKKKEVTEKVLVHAPGTCPLKTLRRPSESAPQKGFLWCWERLGLVW